MVGVAATRVRQDLRIAEAQIRDYQARIGRLFVHDAYLSGLTALRDRLKAVLAGVAWEQTSDSRPGAAELAERIQALKAAHTIEATPQRLGMGRGTAEEPVTARIRRQMERTLAACLPIR